MQRHILFFLYLLATSLGASAQTLAAESPPVVAHVDLQRYLGDWYEIKKIPNRFQRQCVGNTTATYSARTTVA